MGVRTNYEAEQAVIGAMLQDPRAVKKAQRLTAGDFEHPKMRELFEVILRLSAEKKAVDLVTVGDQCPDDAGLMIAAIQAVPTTVNVDAYIDMVLDYSTRRKTQKVAEALYRDMGDPMTDTAAAIMGAKQALMDMGTSRMHDWISSKDIAIDTLNWLELPKDAGVVQSGVIDLDNVIGGFYPGEMTVIGARPGTGKTVMGMLISLSAARHGQKAGIANREMLATQYGQRLISHISGVDGMKLRRRELDPDDWRSVNEAANELALMNTAYQFTAGNIEDLVSVVHDSDIDLLVVDYLQLFRTRQKLDSERLIIGHISRQLKELATDKKIPVVVMSQLRRPEQGVQKMPTMHDLREAGNIEADADGIILLHEPQSANDTYVHPKDKASFDDWKERGLRYIAAKIEKQRNGALGTVAVLFEPSKMRYLGIERAT